MEQEAENVPQTFSSYTSNKSTPIIPDALERCVKDARSALYDVGVKNGAKKSQSNRIGTRRQQTTKQTTQIGTRAVLEFCFHLFNLSSLLQASLRRHPFSEPRSYYLSLYLLRARDLSLHRKSSLGWFALRMPPHRAGRRLFC